MFERPCMRDTNTHTRDISIFLDEKYLADEGRWRVMYF